MMPILFIDIRSTRVTSNDLDKTDTEQLKIQYIIESLSSHGTILLRT